MLNVTKLVQSHQRMSLNPCVRFRLGSLIAFNQSVEWNSVHQVLNNNRHLSWRVLKWFERVNNIFYVSVLRVCVQCSIVIIVWSDTTKWRLFVFIYRSTSIVWEEPREEREVKDTLFSSYRNRSSASSATWNKPACRLMSSSSPGVRFPTSSHRFVLCSHLKKINKNRAFYVITSNKS